MDWFTWELGPIREVLPHFRVARVQPLKKSQPWAYVSCGMSSIIRCHTEPIEAFVLSPIEEALHVELLAMIAHFCADMKLSFGLNRILDIGRPWLEGSSCDHLLISLPYPFGPKLEWLELPKGKKVRFLWALPITRDEAAFARAEGVEALEQLFDLHRINAVDPNRPSVV